GLQPGELPYGQLQLGAEGPGAPGGQLAQVGFADVQLGLQGQGDGAPVGVPGQRRQADPDVAVDMLLAGGPGAGGVVDAGGLDPGAVAGGGGVVDGHPQPPGAEQRLDRLQGADGHGVGLPADRTDGDVALAVVALDAGGAEPGGDGAAAPGEEDAGQQQRQANGRALVQPVGQGKEGAGQKQGQVRQWHGRLL